MKAFIRLILAALMDPRVQSTIAALVERVVTASNADQLASLRADLTAQSRRLEHAMQELEDRIHQRLDDHERRLDRLEAGGLPGPPPPLPERGKPL